MPKHLIVDIGSTYVAWRLDRERGRALHRGHPGSVVTREVGGQPDRVVAGGVAASLALREFADAIEAHWGLQPDMLAATAEARGVRNGYHRPETLGVDRWAAMVAGFVHYGGPALVADCGTALTVDCVDAAGRHLGGWIAPGLGLMREALARGTRLQAFSSAVLPTYDKVFGADTDDAVIQGCLGTLAGALERAQRDGSRACGSECRLLLTGGDAEAVSGLLSPEWRVVPGLVLDGLALLAGERG